MKFRPDPIFYNGHWYRYLYPAAKGDYFVFAYKDRGLIADIFRCTTHEDELRVVRSLCQ